jgi:hypothetical protein
MPMITVRLSPEERAAVKASAAAAGLSMNRFCLERILEGADVSVPLGLPQDWTDILKHTVGVNGVTKPSSWGYRNRYCVCLHNDERYSDLQAMVKAGLMQPGPVINDGHDQYFRATKKGCEAIKIGVAATKRALEEL